MCLQYINGTEILFRRIFQSYKEDRTGKGNEDRTGKGNEDRTGKGNQQ